MIDTKEQLHQRLKDIKTQLRHRFILGIDEPLIRRKIQLLVAFQHFGMQSEIDFHGIGFHQIMGAGIVTGRLDTLYLGKQPAKQVTHFLIIVYHDVRLPKYEAVTDAEIGRAHV